MRYERHGGGHFRRKRGHGRHPLFEGVLLSGYHSRCCAPLSDGRETGLGRSWDTLNYALPMVLPNGCDCQPNHQTFQPFLITALS